ncbi:hypothetical protein O6H91_04G040000 [Diphasiastrum complanatum]|uniref:Uncharacterized protein n=1 Tax=Diphasiastrum complanatum TaxID=34168 RepID=A0ACC2DW39_DIPCM|nr:hypothetical protein O6H91_04G040000 [Diphasiastrum complanatum]
MRCCWLLYFMVCCEASFCLHDIGNYLGIYVKLRGSMTIRGVNLLKYTDEAVAILQDMITILGNYYEDEMKEVPNSPTPSFSAPNLEVVQLTYRRLSEMLASLWPCEKQFAAVFGPTGCGKSTLLNVLLAMICATGEAYNKGIKLDSCRAALRETAKHYGVSHHGKTIVDSKVADDSSASSSTSGNALSGPDESISLKDDANSGLNLDMERSSISGLLGIFCARNRESYMSCHMTNYDKNPFLLLNGRLGDAGTTKVTAVEYGPKFVGRIRWIGRQKLRKRCRVLRQLIDNPECSDAENKELEELKELWLSILYMVKHNYKADLPYPDEQLINSTISTLSRSVPFGKEEVIENSVSKGCTLDRLKVRDGICKRLRHEKLGLLAEDLKLEVPVTSFEGGIGLLDVPGTNDPRKLHQREIWHAIDRTALILFVLDKSVIDTATEKILEESPILEKMLLDEAGRCSLVVVGIAEKDNKGSQSPVELVANFDSRRALLKAIEMIIRKKAKHLVRTRRLSKEVALGRVTRIIESKDRLCILPVLPCLCASIHLSASNPNLHQIFCENSSTQGCSSQMSEQLVRNACLETNMPQLLERVHAIRLPPSSDHLHTILKSAEVLVNLLIQESSVDSTMERFLQSEYAHAEGRTPESIFVNELPQNAINDNEVSQLLDEYCKRSKMSLDDVAFVIKELGDRRKFHDLSLCGDAKFYELAPLILSGYKPEGICSIAHQLIRVVEAPSKDFIDIALKELKNALYGDFPRVDALMDEVSDNVVGNCIALHNDLMERWHYVLDRMRANLLSGGKDGGLHGKICMALRRAYDYGIKWMLREVKQQGNDSSFMEVFSRILTDNEVGQKASKKAKTYLEHLLNAYWEELWQATNEEIKRLWVLWQQEVGKLVLSVQKALSVQQFGKYNVLEGSSLLTLKERLKVKLKGMNKLIENLRKSSDSGLESACYGYNLLQSNPQFCSCLIDSVANDRALGVPESSKTLSGNKLEFQLKKPGNGRHEAECKRLNLESDKKNTILQSACQKVSAVKPIVTVETKQRKAMFLSDEEGIKLQSRDALHISKKGRKYK